MHVMLCVYCCDIDSVIDKLYNGLIDNQFKDQSTGDDSHQSLINSLHRYGHYLFSNLITVHITCFILLMLNPFRGNTTKNW